ncbi:MAG TPA: 4-hydroxy-3-methylbut-2-enyl diphosphate reductase [Romboutsia timonensis]|uniref:4-hydroxy-3-methylbut-2-enyl diphosphate reductase n=1 Tax=Romboutsia timonensis TaxID=1776391 RepID=A0A921N218_9FIRM|nr:4-hydroxy-3-methylbut-2-enyl diphosphate reductase [uncultured Romboutsia sp.]HJG97472.1 4-hydroxy-3-methylbut-2-enyl diphosphate reductase [Romboutsia timonensis]
MKVKIAKEAGFCFGVKRAMKMAWDELELNSDIYALGPLIHNRQAVQKYEDKGLITVDTIDSIPNNESVIIRSHGVSKDIYDRANFSNLNIIDTTCPFVKKIHNIVKEFYEEGFKIIIIGDKNHPEIIGINGWCENSALIIKSVDDLNNLNLDNNNKYCVVAQTTLNLELYNQIVDILSKELDNIQFNNTICSATKTRQQAAKELSVDVDCMIVIGGKHSSNTQKLVNICKEQVPTFSIETKEDLDIDKLSKFNIIGVTAGASTPNWIIEDVICFIESL